MVIVDSSFASVEETACPMYSILDFQVSWGFHGVGTRQLALGDYLNPIAVVEEIRQAPRAVYLGMGDIVDLWNPAESHLVA